MATVTTLICYDFGPFRLDPVRRRLLKDGTPVPLRPKEFDLLLTFVQRQGQDVTKNDLMRLLWPDTVVEENNLPHAISKLRKALNERHDEHRYIVTVPGRGYRFVAPVRRVGLGKGGGAAITVASARATGAPVRATRLMVLPFRVLRPDAEIDFLSFSLADAVTVSLSGLDSLVVRSSAAASQFAAEPLDLHLLTARARVDVVLTGTLLRDGGRLRVTTQLVDVSSGSVLWSQTSQVPLADIFQVQDELVRRIVESLALPLTAHDYRRLGREVRARDVHPQVYAAYLKGRYHLSRRTPESLRRAIACLEAAITVDPGYAPVYAGLADCYLLGGTGALARGDTMRRAKEAAAMALRLDEELPEAHASLASVAFRWAWDWNEAEREFKRAIELDPAVASVRHSYGLFLAAMGRFSEALEEMHRACEIDPVSLVASAGLGRVLDFARRHDEAIEQYQSVIETDAGFAEAYFDLAMALEHRGTHQEALAAASRAAALAPESLVYAHCVAYLRAVNGDRADAENMLRTLDERAARAYVSPMLTSFLLVALGRTDEAFVRLHEACVQRAAEVVYLNVDPDLDGIRADLRFQSVLRQVGFPSSGRGRAVGRPVRAKASVRERPASAR